MRRKIILPLAALALGVLAFVLASRGDRRKALPPTVADGVGRFAAATAAVGSQPMAVIRGGDVGLSGGERPRTRVYDPQTGRVKLEIGAESWRPVTDQTYHIIKPDIRIYSPSGQVSYVTADESEMDVAQAGRKEFEPRRGWLRGNVRVVVDRTTRRWREQNPLRAAREQHPDQLVHIAVDKEARFDMENSRLTADGAVTVHSAEADLAAKEGPEALVLTWNEVDNRAEYLRLQYGGRIVARRAGLVDFSMPGLSSERPDGADADDSVRHGRSKSATVAGIPTTMVELPPASQPPGGSLRSGDQMAALLEAVIANRPLVGDAAASRPGRRRHKRAKEAATTQALVEAGTPAPRPAEADVGNVDTYSAVFSDNVQVKQTQGQRVTGGLDCERLGLVFDFGKEARGAKPESASGAPASRPSERAASRPVGEATELVIEWTGPLELRSVDVEPAEQTGRRFDAVATGRVVHLRDVQGEASCARMIFRKETSAVWLTGSAAAPARVWSGTRREIVATEIAMDRGHGAGRLTGRGLLRDEATSSAGAAEGAADAGKRTEPLEIHWSRDVELELGRLQHTAIDPQTHAARTRTSDFLRRADFHGDVTMVQGARSLSGDEVSIGFGPPRKQGVMADTVTRLDAAGQVRMRDADQRIAARTLHVDMTVTDDGRNVPKRAVADGEVLVLEAGRSFAGEHVTAEFGTATDATAADGKPATRLVMRHATGSRRVAVRDEAQHLDADADQLDARFDAAGRLEKAVLIGPGAAGWAYTSQGDYAVNGHHVTIDLAAQHVAAPGRGHAVFVTRSDFDGRPLSAAAPVNITFSSGMTLDGRDNVGIFNGEVHTSTDTHELTCDQRLVVRFADRHAAGGGLAGTADVTLDLARRKEPGADSPLAKMAQWTRERFGGEAVGKRPATPRVQKQPVYVVAEGHVAALTSEYDPGGLLRSRMRIGGPCVEVDLRREHLLVPGRGSLLIEDYRIAAARGRTERGEADAAEGVAGFGATGGGGPSVTLFNWVNAMSFDAGEALATFDRSVQMNHLSGRKLLLNKTIAGALKANVDALRLGAGRESTLDCDDLVVQFVQGPKAGGAKRGGGPAAHATPPGPPFARGGSEGASLGDLQIRWSELRRLVAAGRVYLRDNTRTLMGDALRLESPSNVVTVLGGASRPAEMTDQDEQTQHVRSWRGPVIRWNRATGDVDAPGTQVTVR